jgi:ATP-dependent RNA helicase HrpB
MSALETARLPVQALEQPFAAVLKGRGRFVITSPTGSGKSTLCPLWAARLAGRALVVEPRRVACRSLARFVAAGLGGRLGDEVGYAVRHDDRLGPRTQVGYVTPGVALAMLTDGAIGADDAVLLDEFHLRGLETDLLLALLLARGHRRLGVLSATLDGARVARHMEAELLEAQGRLHPVELRHVGDDPVPDARHLEERVVAALGQLRRDPALAEGDVLVFLPGKAEIGACLRRLERDPDFEPLPLHAQLSPADQDRPFEPAPGRRVILSTNVAETSVTLPYVRAVIDSGLVRRTIYRDGRGALALRPIALDAAEQRAGRAGRLGPGLCLRLWSARGKLEPRTPPEILREDLSALLLQAAQLGHRAEALPWLDPPRDYAVADARELLGSLGLMDAAGALTEQGQQVGRLPVDPVLGRMLVAGREADVLPEMVLLVAALSLGRPLFAPGQLNPPEPGEPPDPLTEARCDATALILTLADRGTQQHQRRARREACREARKIARQLARLLDADLGAVDAQRLPPERRARLEQAVVAAQPQSPFARRPRRDAWGNGKLELLLARDSLIEEQEVRTMLVVDQHVSAERGRRLKRLATCCMPVAPHRLRQLGAGSVEALAPRVGPSGALLARLQWSIGTTVLQTVDDVPEGDAAAAALHRLLREGRHLAKAVSAARDEVEACSLRASLEGQPALVFEGWLRERIATLGFESGEDLPLLTAADLAPGLLTREEHRAIRERFPGELLIGGLHLELDYDLARREVTLRARASGRPAPRPDFLPRWPGWSVVYHDGKHAVTLRGR